MNPLSILDSKLITNENAAEIFYAIKLARKKLDEMEETIFNHVSEAEKAGQRLGHILLQEGKYRKVIKDVRAVYKSVNDSVSNEEFIACCTVKLGELSDKFCETFEGTKKDAQIEFNRRVESSGGVEMKQSAPTLYLVESGVKHKFETVEA